MEIKNYYLLLELSIDPPEEDPDVIEDAIKKKQALWSKNRNHPTKATQAQQLIGLIPEIRQVMTDESLRKREAKEAKAILLDQQKDAYTRIDRHLAILLGKGSVNKNEIAKLARIDEIDEEKLQQRLANREKPLQVSGQLENLFNTGRISDKQVNKLARSVGVEKEKIRTLVQKKERARFQEIDYYLGRCSRRGYVTTDEIGELARIYNVKEDQVLRRVRCPIQKKGNPKTDKPKPLDKTVEKLIEDKLKIVGKSSLYEFLALSPGADLESLQNKSQKKEAEVRTIGQKDAFTTASGALAGHCIAIFKTEENRRGYDLARTLSRLEELNGDIEVAGMDGKIRPELYTLLIRTAIKMGMDIGEAHEYIQGYCRTRKIALAKSKKKVTAANRGPLMWATAAILVLLVAVGVFVSAKTLQENRLKAAYLEALQAAESQPELEGREVILQNFLKYNEPSEYTRRAEKKIQDIRARIDERDYQKVMDRAIKPPPGDYAPVIAAYEGYLQDHPRGAHAAEARQKIDEIKNRIEDRDFEALQSIDETDSEARIQAYNAYFEAHPDGRHTEAVNAMVSDLLNRYYAELKQNLETCESGEDWETCIELSNEFIAKFRNTEQAADAEGLIKKYENKLQIRSDLTEMKEKAARMGTDYYGARALYLEYIEGNPELPSYLKRLLVKEVKILDQKIEEQNRAEREWEEALAFSGDLNAPLTDRILKLERFIAKYPNGLHLEEAETVLDRLKKEKALEDQRLAMEREEREWRELVTYAQNGQVALSNRITRLEGFLRQNPNGKYVSSARTLLSQLQEQLRLAEERLRRERAERRRRQQARERIGAAIQNSGGRYVDNGNGTITDTKTGKMWTMLDAAFETNRCLKYQTALQYVENLRTGGYQDWRLPTVAELQTILKTAPFFPTTASTWFWTTETFWHGWNKKAVIVTSKPETRLEKETVEVEQCGSALAVRR
jgi:hypothetical protein